MCYYGTENYRGNCHKFSILEMGKASRRKRKYTSDSAQYHSWDIWILVSCTPSIAQAVLCKPDDGANTFNSHNHDGRNVGGSVSGGIVVQGDYHAYASETRQAPTNSSPSPSQPKTEDRQHLLETIQQSLKEIYLIRFRKVYPFSLPFTFDIEKTWVSLALKEEERDSEATEDHAKLLERAFMKAKMLIIEGDPATGKTSLMRRLAYEWANGKEELLDYDLVLYAEFREVRKKAFKSIADLVLGGLKKYLTKEDYEKLKKLVNNERICKECCILVLLDGYDESSLEKQCSELSSYIVEKTINKQLFFNTVITTRKGHLSNLRGREGRFVFAEVLGFTTMQQKETYVRSHFLSESDNKQIIEAVHSLMNNNNNLNKLAETPLFLTFICLVHERIVDGTLLELYCNIIWWLIDRHQQDFPDRDIPYSFGFQNGSNDKFEIIQEHYLHYPQLHCLGNMALRNLEENVFTPSDCAQFSLQPIIEQVGLLRKERKHDDSLKLLTSYHFPHRTIQEFLAAFYCFCSNDPTSERSLPNFKLDTSEDGMNEFERFLFRIALSAKMPIQAEKRKDYFDRITDINLDMITFDAFNTTAGFNNQLLNCFLSHCINVQDILLKGINNGARHESNTLNEGPLHNESTVTTKMSCPALFSFSDLNQLHSVTFGYGCTFSANCQLSFTNCPSLNYLKFDHCEMKSSAIVGIATLPAIDTVEFYLCYIDLTTWQSITDQISNSNVKCLQLYFGKDGTEKLGEYFNKEHLIHLQQCNNIERMEITIGDYEIRQNDLLSFSDLIKLSSLKFSGCTFSANSELSFTNCTFLKYLKFDHCKMKTSTNLGITTLPAIDIVELCKCEIDLAIWPSIIDQINNSNVKYLDLTFGYRHFNKEFLIHLQKCNNVEKMKIIIQDYTIRQNDLLSFSDLIKLHSLTLFLCTFEANSRLLFANCPSLKNLTFHLCKMKRNTILGTAILPAIDTVAFYACNIDLATWQSITDQISNSFVKCLKLPANYFVERKHPEFLHNLLKCERIQQIHINQDFKNSKKEVTASLAQVAQKLPALTSITISDWNGKTLDESKRLSERNKQIEEAGQERNPDFSVYYVE